MGKKQMISMDYSKHLSSYKGEVHSVFERTVNITNYHHELVTIADESLFDGPGIMRIKRFFPKKMGIKEGMTCRLDKSGIILGNEVLIETTDRTLIVLPRLTFPEVEKRMVVYEQAHTLFQQLTLNLDTVGYFRQTVTSDFERSMHLQLIQKVAQLLRDLFTSSKDVTDSLQQLIGLGAGLTPSGDDFLTGLFLVLSSHNYPERSRFKRCFTSYHQLKKDTNLISQTQMTYALEGQALMPLLYFTELLFSGNKQEMLEYHLQEVLQIGSSSGSDMLAGILLGVIQTLSNGGKENGKY